MAIITGTNAGEALVGGAENDTITGAGGNDTITGAGGNDTITGAGGNDKALMGVGNDVFVWNPGDGSDTIEGGVGNDALRLKGENVDETFFIIAGIAGHAELDRFTTLDTVVLDLNDVERIEVQALGGADKFEIVSLGGTDVKQLAFDLSNGTPGVGDGAEDVVVAFGSESGNTVTLTQTGGVISATGLAAQITIAAAEAIDAFGIFGFGGNDKISAASLPALIQLALDGGDGNDSLTGSAGHDTLIGGSGNDTVSGGGGNDTLDGGDGNDSASLGAGNDLYVANAGDGEDEVKGGDGTDTLRFIGNGADETFGITYNGGPASLGHSKVDLIALDDIERIEFRPLGGEDTVAISTLTGTDVTTVVVDLAGTSGGAAADKKFDEVDVDGDNGDDIIKIASVGAQVVVSGLAAQVSVLHADQTDILNIFANAGNDTVDASKLAAGRLELQLFGSIGADTLIGSAGKDFVDAGDGNDLILMGAGNDFFEWNQGDDNDTIEGQAGMDTVRANAGASADVLTLSANGARGVLTYNVGNVTMDLNDVEHVWIRAKSGADAITVNDLSGTDIKLVSLDLGDGGGGDLAFDTVTVNGTNGNDKVKVSFPGAVVFAGMPYQVGISSIDVDKDSITFNALGGNDSIDASKLPAGIVPIVLDGGTGNDVITGGAGDDVVFGRDDNDKLGGGAGDDDLFGGNGNDAIDGGAGDDELIGNNGDDTITGGTGNDIALLAAGNDLFIWSSGDGSDTIEGGVDFDTLRLVGSKAGDTIGISANGTLTEIAAPGGADLDVNVEFIDIRALDGADTINIGDIAGTNVEAVAVDLAATLGGKAADAKVDTVTFTTANTIDTVVVASTKDGRTVVHGPTVDISIAHAGKTDQLVINAAGGADLVDAATLAAGKIALTLNGGVGADTLVGSAGDDTVIGGDGNDITLLGAGSDTFIWNPGDDNDTIEGGAGFDTLLFKGTDVSESIGISAVGARALLTSNVDTVSQDLDDVEKIEIRSLGGMDGVVVSNLTGTDIKQIAVDLGTLAGVADGVTDQVVLFGTTGKDTVNLTSVGGIVSITGLPARVTVAHADASDLLAVDTADGNDSINAATLKASAGRLSIDGGGGNDTITGGLGHDVMAGGDGNDRLLGGGGDDQLFGGDGKDLMDGGAGNDLLAGGDGNDSLTGGIGNDTIVGGEGDDTMTGGTSNDTFRYESILDGHDVILSFDGNPAGGQDVLDLDKLFDSLGVLAADRASRVLISDKGASVDIFVDADGIAGFELSVATLKTADIISVGQDILVGTL